MNIDELKEYREKLGKLTQEEEKQRNLYLKKLANGTLQGPLTGKQSIDKTWLKYYEDYDIKQDIPKMSAYDYMVVNNNSNLDKNALNFYGIKITYEELLPYPNMTFDQGDNPSMYTAEEILVENEFPRKIQVNDRATMLNLMRGLNGYTLCSGIISRDLNGDDYVVVPYEANVENPNSMMEIGYITRKNTVLSEIGSTYIQTMKDYFSNK